ncbi:MAG: WD40 repeat domain-containing protein [Planctomycetota bacterium]
MVATSARGARIQTGPRERGSASGFQREVSKSGGGVRLDLDGFGTVMAFLHALDLPFSACLDTGLLPLTLLLQGIQTAYDAAHGITTLRDHDELVYEIALSQDGRWAVLCGWDFRASLWSLSPDDQALARWLELGDVDAIRFAPGGRAVVFVRDQEVLRLDIERPEASPAPLRSLEGEDQFFRRPRISAEGRWLASDSRVWQLSGQSALIPLFLPGPQARMDRWFCFTEVAPCGSWVVAGVAREDGGGDLVSWALDGGQRLGDLRLRVQPDSAAFSADGRWLLVGHRRGATLYAPGPRAEDERLRVQGGGFEGTQVALSPGADYALVTSGRSVVAWRLDRRDRGMKAIRLGALRHRSRQSPTALAISDRGDAWVAWSDGLVKRWQVCSLRE